MLSGQTLIYLIYASFAASALLVVEALYVQFAGNKGRRAINRRLEMLEGAQSQETSLHSILNERGLTAQGNYASGFIGLNRLFAQSGITLAPRLFLIYVVLAGFAVTLACLFVHLPLLLAGAAGLATSAGGALLYLRRRRTKRQRRFDRQLPDALEMIIRSLKAGHPTNVAISLVAREMPDPLGTEFGIVADEISFGSDLETAIRNLSERVGTESLRILSVAVGIQNSTGGNLTEILSNMSKVLRERVVLEMKIRSLSAEGRLSAILISIFPIAMFLILQVIAPSYYGDIWDSPLVMPVFLAFGGLAVIGDFIMYRMVNFDF